TPFAHVVCHYDQYSRETSHWDQFSEGSERQHNNEQDNSVGYTGNWRSSSIFDIGRGPCNCSRGGNSAKQGRGTIGNSLSNKFCIGAVASSDHSIAHHRRKQGLYSSK